MEQQRNEDGLLGGIVRNIYQLIVSNNNSNLVLYDPVQKEPVRSGQYFATIGRRRSPIYVVKTRFLPADLNVNFAMARPVSGGGRVPELQVSEVDLPNWMEQLRAEDEQYQIRGKSLFYAGIEMIKTKLIPTGKRNGEAAIRRTNLHFLPRYETPESQAAIHAVDVFYERGRFVDPAIFQISEAVLATLPPAQRQTQLQLMAQQLAQAHTYIQEPRPSPRLILRGRVLGMSGQQLEQFLNDQTL